ncbi:hypothetical protein PV05_09022 [Exophiala xenobiotica]|uniref:Uncharacterized protein n=1 Tax=Exophiala xenobiotica TaxID=348802 RepID=A0A0D2EDL4_9EURO|nr:uncharacterized protein PV05_09022 [Exophiala xenobiotica]KIW53448.1 hypothetical protein PV05_09022 [Exophiala xenobiotica]
MKTSSAQAQPLQRVDQAISHMPALQGHPEYLANESGYHDEFLQTAQNLDNLQYPLEPDEDTLPPRIPLGLEDYLRQHHLRPDYDTLPPPRITST